MEFDDLLKMLHKLANIVADSDFVKQLLDINDTIADLSAEN